MIIILQNVLCMTYKIDILHIAYGEEGNTNVCKIDKTLNFSYKFLCKCLLYKFLKNKLLVKELVDLGSLKIISYIGS